MGLSRQCQAIVDALKAAGRGGLTTWDLAMATHILNPGKRVSEVRRLLGPDSIVSEREGATEHGDQIWRYWWGLTTAPIGCTVQVSPTTGQGGEREAADGL